MGSERLDPPNALADWLRRVIVVSGYVLGTWWLVDMLLNMGVLLDQAHRFQSPSRGLLPYLVWREFTWVTALVLLLIGTWGFHRHRRWGRPVLRIAAALMLVALFVIDGISLFTPFFGPRANGIEKAAVLSHVVTMATYEGLFPLLLLLCLRRPELIESFADAHRGFTPLTGEDAPTPVIPVARPPA